MKILKFHRVSWLVSGSSRNIKHGGSLCINFHGIREYWGGVLEMRSIPLPFYK